ncbi:MAG: radical SAM protein [Clostridiales bacterium]|nr:radical SAM protein [Clostridiales bacterium]
MYISHYVKNTSVLGPGKRFALWLQGCKKQCKGCIFPEGQGEVTKGKWISTEELLDIIQSVKGIHGITISGGEPFLQIDELMDLCRQVKEHTKLDIILYSGYRFEELEAKYRDRFYKICSYIDILIDGEYVEALNDNQAYRGSSNQTIHMLSDKYKPYLDQMNQLRNRTVELKMNSTGELVMIGIPYKGFQDDLIHKMVNQCHYYY